MEVVMRKISELKPAEYNPRQVTEEQAAQIEASLREFGAVDPAIINMHSKRKNRIVGGHQRLRIASERLGWEEYPCVEVKLTKAKERELNVRLNKNVGEWDWDKLANEFDLPELTDWGFSEKELFAFSPDEFGEDFELPDGEKGPLEQITFTLANPQADEVKRAIAIAKDREEFSEMETHENENSNGNALALIVEQWLNSLPKDSK